MSVSLSMVASKAGTSKAAVSRAFNSSEEVSEKTRQKIFKVAADLGYVHNVVRSQHARMFRNQNDSQPLPVKKSNLITLLFYKTNRQHIYSVPYYQTLVELLEKTFRTEGVNFIEAYPQDETEYRRIIETAITDGLVLISNIEQMSDEFITLLRLYSAQKPLIFLSNYIGPYRNQFHCVRSDDISVGVVGAEYCCQRKEDHILFVDSGLGMAVVDDRFLGYRSVLERVGKEPVRILFNVEKWQIEKVSDLKGKLSLPEGNITFQCASDSTLFAFIEFLKEENIFDATRMHFVGMDGIPGLSFDDVREASVQVDLESMARETFHLIDDSLTGKVKEPKTILVGCKLIQKS